MKREYRKAFIGSALILVAFIAFTLAAAKCDVKPIGPEGSEVGLASINGFMFELLGVRYIWYEITDWLGLLPLAVAFGFALLGLGQLIKRKSLKKVDSSMLVLGGFYVLVISVYVLFEKVVINCRPVLMQGILEPSYPSSHTLMVICIMASAAKELRVLFPSRKLLCAAVDIIFVLIIALTIIGRLISGVHWFTDIVGGVLLSCALLSLHSAVLNVMDKKNREA